MKLYKLNKRLVKKPNLIIMDNKSIVNPTEEDLLKAGYELVKENKPTNYDIYRKREKAYKDKTDSLFISYLIHKELGETEEAEKIKQQWIAKRNSIKSTLKYDETQISVKDYIEKLENNKKQLKENIAKLKAKKENTNT